jgi:hypothetical protein
MARKRCQTSEVYWSQKARAKVRGVQWLFSKKKWVKWWEDNLGPDWIKLRGRRKHQYCMARNGDKGPYAPWNVRCITNEQNSKEQTNNLGFKFGEKHYKAKLSIQEVFEILNSEKPFKWLMKKYKVSKTTISHIKSGVRWKQAIDKHKDTTMN